MANFVIVVAVTAFLAGAATAVFAMLVIGIRRADRPWQVQSPQDTPLDTFARGTLGTGSWPTGSSLGDPKTK